ncbi:MAG: glycosyltransferase [Candidatus Dormibacteria bacterium]
MRVLFVASPGFGHINPLLPLAYALKERGHEVRWAVAAEFVAHLEKLGFVTSAAGLGERERWREVREIVGADPDGDGPPAGFGGPTGFATLFGRVSAPRMAESLTAIVAAWRPDLFVHDMSELASAITATALGIPHVTHSWAWSLAPETFQAAAVETAALWSAAGLPSRADAGVFQHLFLHPYPRGLAGSAEPGPNLQPIRPAAVVPAVGESLPGWLASVEGAVYVTLGTIFNHPDTMVGLAQSLARLGRPVVITTGPRVAPGALGELPANCHVAQYIAQDAILPRCDLVVSHAGAGTFLGAAACGVPQVCVPQGADQFINAEAAVRSGMGIALMPDHRDPGQILAAARTVLADGSFRARALGIQAEIASMPSAEEVAPLVEALAKQPAL